MAAGIYSARKKINALLIAKNFGGQAVISAKIENFIGFKEISGVDMAKTLEEHLKSYNNIEIKEGVSVSNIGKIENGFTVTDSNNEIYQAKNVLITLGSSYRKLGAPGEKEFEGKGVFYCSICDAPLMKGKPAAVIGGGNSGMNAVVDLLPYASEIYLLEKNGLKGDPVLLEKIKKEPRVKVMTGVGVEEISGDILVNSLKYKDASGETGTLSVSGIFVEIGYQPNTDIVKDLVRLNDKKEIIVDHQTMKTSHPGIWAAGDITDSLYNQINTAIGDGIKAALNVYDSLMSK